MRLIDADAELRALERMKVEGEVSTTAVNFAKIILREAPTIDQSVLAQPINVQEAYYRGKAVGVKECLARLKKVNDEIENKLVEQI